MIEEILDDAKERMGKAVEHVQNEFGTILVVALDNAQRSQDFRNG